MRNYLRIITGIAIVIGTYFVLQNITAGVLATVGALLGGATLLVLVDELYRGGWHRGQ